MIEYKNNDAVITDSAYTDRNPQPGINGKRFTICLSKPFKNGDVISADLRNAPSLIVTEEQITLAYDAVGFLHRVEIASLRKSSFFYPKEYLVNGTQYVKLDTVIDDYYKHCTCRTSNEKKVEQIEKLKRSASIISAIGEDTDEIDSVISDLSGEEYHTKYIKTGDEIDHDEY